MVEIINSFIPRADCKELAAMADLHESDFSDSSGVRRQVGINGGLSDFYVWKYWKFSSDARELFDRVVPLETLKTFNEAWFLRFKKDGFFDTYKSKSDLFNIISVPLRDGQRFIIGDEEINTVTGNAIKFNLATYHEVPIVTTTTTNDYLVFIVLD